VLADSIIGERTCHEEDAPWRHDAIRLCGCAPRNAPGQCGAIAVSTGDGRIVKRNDGALRCERSLVTKDPHPMNIFFMPQIILVKANNFA
jgi:hypothetical protein